ncbi:MFS transporter [Calidifontibacter sp. DB0510]|uniref:MFS transporter n=1 Tax=Metallococcus carri TaxID=1656884 RepID=A0A967E8K7_9MICO|nr:MFS transporter [Metallococcus carri]NHN55322.1 MFS transporter [Metallococcus carri]NOP36399.1 MFS transporter [Calidifontibacter sp. DB2511S]
MPTDRSWTRVALTLFAIGWGANQFSALLPVYRREDGLSQTTVTAIFAAYVIGLIPALIVAARLSGRFGHRAVLRPVVVGAIVASAILAAGAQSPAALFVGRAIYGLMMGASMAPATTWVKELSFDAPTGTGARRAAMSMSAGFGAGPLASGLIAQFLPAPTVLPYAVHIALMLVAGALVWSAPQPARPVAVPGSGTMRARHTAWSGQFWWRIAPMAPWVFTCATVGFLVGPSFLEADLAGWELVFLGLTAALTLGTGVLVQQPARRIEARHPGLVTLLGMAATVVGLLCLAVVARQHLLWLTILVSVVLGAGYGLNLVGGLVRVEHTTPLGELAMTNAVFYCLTYLGFFAPTTISALSERFDPSWVLVGGAGAAVVSAVIAESARRHAATTAAAAPAATR